MGVQLLSWFLSRNSIENKKNKVISRDQFGTFAGLVSFVVLIEGEDTDKDAVSVFGKLSFKEATIAFILSLF